MNKVWQALLVSTGLMAVSYANAAHYIGGGYGYRDYDNTSTAANVTVNNYKRMGTLFAGYLRGEDSLRYGLELRGNWHRDKQWSIVGDAFSLKTNSISLSAIARYDVKCLYLQANAGMERVEQINKHLVVDPTSSLHI